MRRSLPLYFHCIFIVVYSGALQRTRNRQQSDGISNDLQVRLPCSAATKLDL